MTMTSEPPPPPPPPVHCYGNLFLRKYIGLYKSNLEGVSVIVDFLEGEFVIWVFTSRERKALEWEPQDRVETPAPAALPFTLPTH